MKDIGFVAGTAFAAPPEADDLHERRISFNDFEVLSNEVTLQLIDTA